MLHAFPASKLAERKRRVLHGPGQGTHRSTQPILWRIGVATSSYLSSTNPKRRRSRLTSKPTSSMRSNVTRTP
jgi:hypothetical protein